MKTSQLKEAIRNIVKSKLNKIKENNDGFSSAKYGEDSSSNYDLSDTFGIGSVSNKSGSLTATLYKNGQVKVALYDPGSGGMPIRTLIGSPKAVNINDLTFEYIKDYINGLNIGRFPDEDIQNLMDRVNTTLRPKITEGKETSDYVKAMDIWKRVKQHPTMSDEERETYKQKLLQAAKNAGIELDLNEGPDGLWKNIRDKRERGEKPARKGSEAYKTAVQAGKRINSEK
jgi:hypothetical protein